MFRMAKEHLGESANEILKGLVKDQGYDSTNGMPVSAYNKVVGEIMKLAEEKRAGKAEAEAGSEQESRRRSRQICMLRSRKYRRAARKTLPSKKR